MKKYIWYTLLGIICLLIVIGFTNFYINSKSDNAINSNNKFISYSTDYYTINLPSNISSKNKGKYETMLYINNKMVGNIDVNPNCSYCTTTSSIIANWMGMHAYAKTDIIEQDFGNYKMAKVLIAFELSAAQQISGISPEPDQLHYFYTDSNNWFIDLFINNEIISEENADMITNSFIVKK